ncbi:hypothetical protein Q0812_09670 [Brevundimonas sp. 2R-24]|uniref:Glycine zipper domain-containing protein n=1 Tax=Peiella sedimenti TaxID=3061083 RepID=A0ABT8SMB2_9CAUL|nr:hypothetical protein [Caulobacteraceae bacterium XZ-24]
MTPTARRLAIAAALMAMTPALSGCLVGAAAGVAGAVVGAGVSATGAVVGAGVDAVTTSDAETMRKERRACERRVRDGSREDCRRYRTDD